MPAIRTAMIHIDRPRICGPARSSMVGPVAVTGSGDRLAIQEQTQTGNRSENRQFASMVPNRRPAERRSQSCTSGGIRL